MAYTVSELIRDLQFVPNPSATVVSGVVGVDLSETVSGGIELEDGGTLAFEDEEED